MALIKKLGFFGAPLAIMVAGAAAAQGCDGDEIAKQCGLECSAVGVAGGDFSISGVSSVDGFFAAVVRVDTVTTQVTGDIRAQLDGIAVSLGLEPGATGAEIKAALQAKFAANLEGGLKIDFQPAK